jgi:hypothetical protein
LLARLLAIYRQVKSMSLIDGRGGEYDGRLVVKSQRDVEKLTRKIIPLLSRKRMISSISKLPLLIWYPLGAPTEVEKFVEIIHTIRH